MYMGIRTKDTQSLKENLSLQSTLLSFWGKEVPVLFFQPLKCVAWNCRDVSKKEGIGEAGVWNEVFV